MNTTRLNAAERKVFAERYQAEKKKDRYGRPTSCPEPALGALDERLGNIVRRQGGTTGPLRMSDRERREYAAWCRAEGVENGFDRKYR